MAVTPTFIEGFDDGIAYSYGNGWNVYKTGNGSNRYLITGRTGSALRMRGEGGGGAQCYTIQLSNLATHIGAASRITCGMAIRTTALGLTNGDECPMAFLGTNSIGLKFDATGRLLLKSGVVGNGTTIASSSGNVMTINAWTYFEYNILFGAGGTGNVEVRVNGSTQINTACSVSGLTQFLVSNNIDSSTSLVDIDDFYIGTADNSTDFLGDHRVYTLFPNGNGTTNDGVGSDADSTDNYLHVDETTVSTTDYVDLSPGTNRELYATENLPFSSGSVTAVQQIASVERTDSGSADVKLMAKNGANETIGSAQTPAFGSVSYLNGAVQTTKPGGGAWSPSDVNSTEFGIETV